MTLVIRFLPSIDNSDFWVDGAEIVSPDFKYLYSVLDGHVVYRPAGNEIDKIGVYAFITELTDYQENAFRDYIKKAGGAPSTAVLITKALRACQYFPYNIPVDMDLVTMRDLYLMLSAKHKMPENPNVGARPR